MIPTIVYIFIIAFYLMSTKAISTLRELTASAESDYFHDQNTQESVLSEEKLDNGQNIYLK